MYRNALSAQIFLYRVTFQEAMQYLHLVHLSLMILQVL
jgi:hypothetical protein